MCLAQPSITVSPVSQTAHFQEFGGRVKTWITLNEPRVTSLQVPPCPPPSTPRRPQGYGDASMAPGVQGLGTTAYVSAHNQVSTALR